ncbi:MAG: alpha/beta hydrolase fold domain-containing protein, partial [Halieaceae bacterium]|nr:alpha/beta hydrolase fold domain-containing protein [Halieaceae bacterium]
GDVESREALLAASNSPRALEQEAMMVGMFNAADNEAIAPKSGLRIDRQRITSQPDGNSINLCTIRPDNDETLPCVYYIHGGGMMTLSCFYGNYQTWGRLIAHQGVAVVMVDFRNCLRPSSVPEVEPFPAGLNDCVSGFQWIRAQAETLNINPKQILIAGESGGGNLAIATTMKLIRDGQRDALLGLYALCPYISGQWPRESLPSSTENDGIFITVGTNRGAMAYGIEALENEDPLAWPYFASEADLSHFPPTVIRVNECDPLRDEGIAFYRNLNRAGVKAQCTQSMGTIHASETLCSIVPDISRACARDMVAWIQECAE